MEALQQLPAVQVRERGSVVQEAASEVGVARRYQVLDSLGAEVFYAVERADCCRRQMQLGCCHDCASWEVDVLYTQKGNPEPFLTLRRPCSATCCCFRRPRVEVIDDSTQLVIGSIEDPWACGGMRYHFRDGGGREVLSVYRGCCHPGLLCPLPCGPCSRVRFEVRDFASRHVVARVEKQAPGFLSFLFASDVDKYRIEFQAVQNAEWKSMLMAFALFIDFRHFGSNRPSSNARARVPTDQVIRSFVNA